MVAFKKTTRRGGGKTKKVLVKKAIKKVAKKKLGTSKISIKNKKNKVVHKKTTKKKIIGKRKIQKKNLRKTIGKIKALSLERSKNNPIIEPEENLYWESKASFNPTALYHDGKVHIIYRAIGDNDVSVLGYVKSSDGYGIDKHSKELAYYHKSIEPISKTTPNISYCSGGGWGGGCEDPRLVSLDGKVYMIYTAFDGWGSVRIALTSISLDDFIKRQWGNWRKPVLISPPGEIHKNLVLFPEKINKKYAILHRVSPKIMIDYFEKLEDLGGDNFIHSIHQGSPLWWTRDKFIRGVGPAPLKTKYGWLILYHKMEKNETHRYKLWAMLLDLKDPSKILYNSVRPILEPDLWYENEGYKAGVVYSCGAIIKDKKLFVYYGGADKVSCVATADLDKFLQELVRTGGTKVNKKSKI
jgi:predicted GH43/DUF377 family glycosyl hydrolase